MNEKRNDCLLQGKSYYSLEKHLKFAAEYEEQYCDLYSSWLIDKKLYTESLKCVALNYSNYSTHDAGHSWSIINKIERLLGEERIKALSPTDTFMILETAFLHDFGMIISEAEKEEFWGSEEFKFFLEDISRRGESDLRDAVEFLKNRENFKEDFMNGWPLKVSNNVFLLLQEYYRRHHTQRSFKKIMQEDELKIVNCNDLIPIRLRRQIALFSMFHGVDFNFILEELHKEDNGIGMDTVHPRLIACLIRIGDLLDLDNGRFNPAMTKVIKMPRASQVELEKHQSITHFYVSPERIEVSAVCKDEETYRSARAWFNWLEQELKNLSCKWSEIVPDNFGGPPCLKNIQLSIKNRDKRCENLNFRFMIEQKLAMHFIEGEGIYNNKFDCIREVIQNALDATRIRIWNDIKSKRYDNILDEGQLSKKDLKFISDIPQRIRELYPITISLTEDTNGVTWFSIEDNGCGISSIDLKRIERVGSSWRGDKDSFSRIDSMPEWMRPTGSFGIGIHSLFMLTKELEITTRSDADIGYKIKFVSSRDNGVISVESVEEPMKIGTIVKFAFNEQEITNIHVEELEDQLREWVEEKKEEIDEISAHFRQEQDKDTLVQIVKYYVEMIRDYSVFFESNNTRDDLSKWNEYPKDLELIKRQNEQFDIYIRKGENDADIIAYVRDWDTGTELEFSLLDEQEQEGHEVIPLLFRALRLKGKPTTLGERVIYYKGIYCETIQDKLFNIRINYVANEARKLLNVNRNKFKAIAILKDYFTIIEKKIIPMVIKKMWEYKNDEKKTIGMTNEILLDLYYNRILKDDMGNSFLEADNAQKYKRTEYDCIRLVGEDDKESTGGKLYDLFTEECIILTRWRCGEELIKFAKKNGVHVILDCLDSIEYEDIHKEIELLGFPTIEYCGNDTYLAYRKKDENQICSLCIDYSIPDNVGEYLKRLCPMLYECCDHYKRRFKVDAFYYKNNNPSKIRYLVTNDGKIYSPFTKDLDKDEVQGQHDLNECIKLLEEKCNFEELIKYVSKNSIENKGEDEVRNAYKELIDDFIKYALEITKQDLNVVDTL